MSNETVNNFLQNVEWNLSWPKLDRYSIATLLSYYGYLNYSLEASQIPDHLRPDGIMTYLWTEAQYNYPNQLLTKHPHFILSELEASFNSSKELFLSLLSGPIVDSILNDEANSTNGDITNPKYCMTWEDGYGSARLTTPAAVRWDTGAEVPSGDSDTIAETIKAIVDKQPSGYKHIYFQGAAQRWNYETQNFKINKGDSAEYDEQGVLINTTTDPFMGTFHSDVATTAVIEPTIASELGNDSGLINYQIPSGYPLPISGDNTEAKNRLRAWLKSYQDAGGELDWFVMDLEGPGFSANEMIDNVYYSGTGGFVADTGAPISFGEFLVSDTRWEGIKANYPGMPADSEITGTLTAAQGAFGYENSFGHVVNEQFLRLFSNIINDTCYDTLREYYPSANLFTYAENRYKAPSIWAHSWGGYRTDSPSGIGQVAGSHNGLSTYLGIRTGNNEVGTGAVYQDWTGDRAQPPQWMWGSAADTAHTGSFLGFWNSVGSLHSTLYSTTIPIVSWITSPLNSPYYPNTVANNTGGTRKTGDWDYLYDEYNLHAVLLGELMVWNPSSKSRYIDVWEYDETGVASDWVPGGFSPSGISGLICWLDAGQNLKDENGGFMVAGTGGYVGSWESKYGDIDAMKPLGFTNAPVSTTCTELGGEQAVYFDGVDDLLTLDRITGAATGNFTVIGAICGSGVDGMYQVWLGSRASYNATGFFSNDNYAVCELNIDNDGDMYALYRHPYGDDTLTSIDIQEGNPPTGVIFGYTVEHTPELPESRDFLTNNNMWVTVNGQIYDNATRSSYEGITNFLDESGSEFYAIHPTLQEGLETWQIGVLGDIAGQGDIRWANFFLGELLIYDKALTDSEMRQVQAYLANKYSTTPFFTYPTRTETKESFDRISDAIIQLEEVAGGSFSGTPVVKHPVQDYDNGGLSGMVSTVDMGGKLISRVTPNPEFYDELVIQEVDGSGCSFTIGDWYVEFPRGDIYTTTGSYSINPSGYWVVQTNRSGDDRTTWLTNRALTLEYLTGSGNPNDYLEPSNNYYTSNPFNPVKNVGNTVLTATLDQRKGVNNRFANSNNLSNVRYQHDPETLDAGNLKNKNTDIVTDTNTRDTDTVTYQDGSSSETQGNYDE